MVAPDAKVLGWMFIAAGVGLFVWSIKIDGEHWWHRERIRMTWPYALMALSLIGFVTGAVFSLRKNPPPAIAAPASTPVVSAPIEINAYLPGIDHPPGMKVEGIEWKKGYSHSRLRIANRTNENYLDLDVIIAPEIPIIDAKIQSEFATCKIGPIRSAPVPTIITVNKDGKIGGAAEHVVGSDVSLGPPYRLFCEKLPKNSEIFIDLATAQPVSDWTTTNEIFSPERRDPTFIDVFSTYTAFGSRHEDKSRLSFGKADAKIAAAEVHGRAQAATDPAAPAKKKRVRKSSIASPAVEPEPAAPAFDMAEARATVRSLWNLWLDRDGVTDEEANGLKLPPDGWMNDQLEKRGRAYRVKAEGAQFKIFAAERDANGK